MQAHHAQSQHAGNDARMRDHLFHRGTPVRDPGIDGQASGPHHDALRDQVNAGQHQARGPEHALRHRVSEKARVGADHGIRHIPAPRFTLPRKRKPSVHNAEHLNANGDQKHGQVLPRRHILFSAEKRMENIAGQHHIQYKVRDHALGFPAQHPGLPGDKAHRDHDKDGKFQ